MTRGLFTAVAASLLLGAAGSCQMFRPSAPTWHYGTPAAKGGWARQIAELDYQAASLQDAAAELERKANAGGGPAVSIRVHDSGTAQFPPVTFKSQSITLSDALRYLSEIANTGIRYSDHTVEFTRQDRGSGFYQSVTCTGRVTDARTGRPIERVSVTTVGAPNWSVLLTTNGTYETEFGVATESIGTTPEPFLKRQVLYLDVWAPEYQWAERRIDIQPSNHTYRLDVALTPAALDFRKLADLAARHGVPMPPPGAQLVLARRCGWLPVVYTPAYLLEQKPDGSIVVLRGLDREELKPDEDRKPLWLPFSFAGVVPDGGDDAVDFNRRAAFVCAVQTAAAGRDDVAREIWKRFAVAERWNDGPLNEDPKPYLKSPDMLLARYIFDRLSDRLLRDPAGWKDIHVRMTALLKDFPKLKSEERTELCADLAAAVNFRPAPTGSVETLLVDWSRQPHGMMAVETGYLDAWEPLEIVGRGYRAVPDLLRLMDDRRVTAHGSGAMMGSRPQILRLGLLAYTLVWKIAGEKPPLTTDGDAALRAWWAKAKHQDEATALAEGAFVREAGKIVQVNDGPVHVLALKFPGKLPALCEEFSKHATPETWSEGLAWELAGSNLPQETRIRQLSEFAQRGSLGQRQAFLACLAGFDPKACVALLLPVLRTLPKDATGPYWICPEARLANAVVQLDDGEVWREYLRRARESTVALRMEMMSSLARHDEVTRSRLRSLAFVAAFLNDESVRVIPEGSDKFEGPCAGFTIPRLAVRDLAAMLLSSMLDMNEHPDRSWTEAQWAELRARVKERLAKEALPEL